MQNNDLVTIICSCYNQQHYVIECLNSVLNQTYPYIELIIVDDFSTDNSKSTISIWLQEHPEVRFIANPNNLGITRSFNKALEFATGQYIIDLAADDVLLVKCVETQVKAFQNSSFKNLGVVYGNVELISENGTFESYYFPVNSKINIIEKRVTGNIYKSVLTGGNSVCSVSAMIKKSVFDRLCGYDELLIYEDLDFWIRSSRIYDFDFIDEPIAQKRIVANSLGNHFFKKNNLQTKKINYSNYLILKKAIKLNKTKEEDLALQKRIHNSIIRCFKNRNYYVVLKNLELRIILAWRKNFKNYNA